MEENSIITNILSIIGAGLLILLTGICFLIFKDFILKHIRFFLPIPPIAVAAYIYVYNFYQNNNGQTAFNTPGLAKEIFLSISIASISFAVFVVLLLIFIDAIRRFFA